MYHTIYGWPATGARHSIIEEWDCVRNTTRVLEETYRDVTYAYEAPDARPAVLLVSPVYLSNRGRPYAFPVNDPPSLCAVRWMVRAAVNDLEIADGVDYQHPASPKWPDREIDGYIREALGLLNNFHQRTVIIETKVKFLRPETIAGLKEIEDISYWSSSTKEWLSIPQFSRRGRRSAAAHYWDLENDRLRLYGTFSEDTELEIRALAPFPVPMNDTQELIVDREDWDILSIYAQAKCYIRLAGQSAQLDRWKEEGRRNDNPITPVGRLLLEDALSRIKQRRGPRATRRYRA